MHLFAIIFLSFIVCIYLVLITAIHKRGLLSNTTFVAQIPFEPPLQSITCYSYTMNLSG